MVFGIVEGFYMILKDKSIFYAKGVSHPPKKLVAFPKYVPSPSGDRVHSSGFRYLKIPGVDAEMDYVKKHYPHYIVYDDYFCRSVPMIPLSDVEMVLNPVEKAKEILNSTRVVDGVINDIRDFLVLASEIGGVRNIGVSGSVLAGLHKSDSDIDVVVYGFEDSIKMYRFLSDAINDCNLGFSKYSRESLHKLYRERIAETPIPFEKFVEVESRRVLEGFFKGREYFVRLVKEPDKDDVYGVYKCRKIGVATLRLRIEDDSQAIYTPCRYKVHVEDVVSGVKANVEEVYSLRGRFNEIAKKGEVALARGSVELLEYGSGMQKYRLYIGDPGDFIYPIR